MSRVEIREAELNDRDALRGLMNTYIYDFYQYPRPEEEKLENLLDVLLEKKQARNSSPCTKGS